MKIGHQFKEVRLVKNAAWLLVLQAVNTVLPLVTIPYVTRVFGVDMYGMFSICVNWITYFQIIIEYGFNLSAVRKVVLTKKKGQLDRLVSAVISARILLLFACFIVAVSIGIGIEVSSLQFECLLTLFLMLFGMSIQLNWLFQGLQDMRIITVSTALSRLLSVVLIFLLVTNNSQLIFYAVLYSVTFVLSGVITHVYARRKYSIKIKIVPFSSIVEELKDGFAIFLSSAAGGLIGSFGVTVLSLFYPASVVGSYTAILKIPQTIANMFSPIGQALYPRINEIASESKKDAIRFVVKCAIPILAAFAIVLFCINVCGSSLIAFLFGEEYLLCLSALAPLSFWVLLSIVNNFLGVQLLLSFNHQKVYSKLIVIDSICTLLLSLLLGISHGATGVAVALLLSEVVLSLMLIAALGKRLISIN